MARNQGPINDNDYSDLSGDQLAAVLNTLPAANRLAFATTHQDKIQDGTQLGGVLEALPTENRQAFATTHQDKIQDGEELTSVLKTLSEAGRLVFAIGYQATIQHGHQLACLLRSLPEANREAFATPHQAKIQDTYQLVDVLEVLPEESCEAFARLCQATIQNGDELVKVLKFLPEENREAFATPHQAKIQHGTQLVNVLELLPEENREAFAGFCQDKIQYGYQLINVLGLLPAANRLAFATPHHAKIRDGIQLAEVLEPLPEEDRLAFARLCQAKIQHGYQLVNVLELLPEEKRLDFAGLCQAKIQDVDQLASVLEALLTANREALVGFCQAKIQDVDELVKVLESLPAANREALVGFCQAKIQDVDELVKVLELLPEENREAFATTHQAKIQHGTQLVKVLRVLLEENRLDFAMTHQDKIRSIKVFDEIISAIEYNAAPVPDKRRRLAEACCSAVRVAYSLREKNYSRDLFNDPAVQQLIVLQKVDANVFLFAAATNPASNADFEFFLTHPLCSVTALNGRAQNVELFIQESVLEPELKASRIAQIKAAQKLKREALGRQTIGFNLSSIQQTALKFTGDLPEAVGADWTVPGVDVAEIKRFRQLIQWLRSQPVLVSFQDYFRQLEGNPAIRTELLFPEALRSLDNFVAELATYLEQNPSLTADSHQLTSHLDACDQMNACAAGAINSLQSMTRSFNSGAFIANAVDVALDQSTRVFIDLTGIPANMEVHASKDQLQGLLGLDSAWRYDSYRLPISPVYLQAIARDATGRLTPDYLISQTLPSLESLAATSLLFNAEGRALLERDWQVLYSTGLLEYTNEGSAKWIAVMCFINSEMTEASARGIMESWDETQSLERTLTPQELKERYQVVLENKGILTRDATQMDATKEVIWNILTREGLDDPRSNVLKRLLEAPNGLSLIKAVIDSKTPEQQNQIRLSTLLHSPEGSSTNLFRSLAADPYLAGWMMGWQFKKTSMQAGFDLSFTPMPSPLANAVAQLASNEDLMHKELEEIFMLPGNLLFWLGELQKDPQRHTTFTGIMGFLSAQPLYQFDNLLAVLDKMMSAGDELQRTTAKSFLEARCAEQKSQGLWHCYWKTASYIDGFAPDFLNKDLLLSLKDPANARAAVFLSQSKEELYGKILQAGMIQLLSRTEAAVIIKTIQGLDPRSSIAEVDGATAVSRPTDEDHQSAARGPR